MSDKEIIQTGSFQICGEIRVLDNEQEEICTADPNHDDIVEHCWAKVYSDE